MGLRQERLADEIRDIIANYLTSGDIHDGRLSELTITHVRLSSDLQIATIYFRVFMPERLEEVKLALTDANSTLRRRVAGKLRMRRVPTLRFFYDESIEHGSNIEKLLQAIS